MTGAVKRNPPRTRVDAAGVNGKVIGCDDVHIAIDDATRLAYAEVLGLPLGHPLARRPRTRHPAPPHPALPAADNGKAERLIPTLLAGWAYRHLPLQPRTHRRPSGWLDRYNYRRPHGSLSHQPPDSRLQQPTGNLIGSYS